MITDFLYFYNIVFIIFTTYIFIKATNSIFNYRSRTIADYVLCIIYFFNCIPVLLDITIGVPNYVYWYSAFQTVIIHEETCLIYNLYITLSMFILYLYKRKKDISQIGNIKEMTIESWGIFNTKNPGFILYLIIIFPIVYTFAKYGFNILLQYKSMASRGFEDEFLLNTLISISTFYSIIIFTKKDKKSFLFILFFVLYALLIILINGKRFIIITLIIMLMFCYEQYSQNVTKKRINLKTVYSVIFAFILSFSIYYSLTVRADNEMSSDMYAATRVDFGRDDVIKFVINREFFQNRPILDYPGQTYLSTIFSLVPRSIWPDKPYPHYRYLTAAILGLGIDDIPAGTTPSFYEQGIANFGVLGIIITCFVLLVICKFADVNRNTSYKLLILLIQINLLTQSFDMALPFFILIIADLISRLYYKKTIC